LTRHSAKFLGVDRGSPKFAEALRATPGFQSVTSDLQLANPQVDVQILQKRAQALNFAFGGTQVGTIYAATNQYPVILDLARRFQQNLSALDNILLPGTGGLVPLSSVT